MKPELTSLSKFKRDYYRKFMELFVREYGFFFSENRVENFKNILTGYLEKSPYEDFGDFYNYLANTAPGKLLHQQIMDDITIGETYFFRNEPQIETFRDHILPEIVKSKRIDGVTRIKIWSAGCSTGEEPYTLAIILLENLPIPKSWEIQILATDINRKFLKHAEEGVYSSSRPKRHLDQVLLQKYFNESDGRLSVKNEVKRLIRFSYHNLVKDPYNMETMIDADVIFCRNVTIYFNNETTKAIVNRFYDCLRDGGYLFIGHSENLWNICEKFRVLDFPKGFIYKKGGIDYPKKSDASQVLAVIPEINLSNIGQAAEKDGGSFKTPIPKSFQYSSGTLDRDASPSESLEKLMELDAMYSEGVINYENKDFDAAMRIFSEIIRKDERYLIAHFALATIFSNQGKYEQAMKELDFLINTDNLFLEAYYLKSILHIKLHDNPRAIQTLQKVIYIDPNHALSYFQLANLYRECGKLSNAKLAWTNLKRVCLAHSKTEMASLSDNVTYETLETIAEKALSEYR